MASVDIKVPSVGESISEGILSRWLKPDGAPVKAGEPLFELETDKASTPVPAESSGVLKIVATEGSTVAVGSVVGSLDPDAVAAATASPQSAAPAAKPAPLPPTPEPIQATSSSNGGGGGAALETLAPSVRRVVAETGIDPSRISGTGRDGRLTKSDVLTHASATAATAATASAPSPTREPSASETTPARSTGRESRQRMSGIRQKIAQRLVEVQQTAAILTTFNEADMSRVMDLRARYKEPFNKKHGVNLGFMSFFVKAVVEGLKAYPAVNGRVEGNDLVFHHDHHVGVAVSTERGLMVPVLRDADRMSFAAIEKAIGDYAKKARDGKIAVSDLQGGTFTITNGGVFGSLLSTPILNPPQSGILGMHTIQKRPVAVDDQVVIRPMMYLALSYDHRIIDGREAVSFLVKVKEGIENPERLLLEI